MRRKRVAEDDLSPLPSRWVVESKKSAKVRHHNLALWAYDNLPPRVKHLIGTDWITETNSYMNALDTLERNLRYRYSQPSVPEHMIISRDMFQQSLVIILHLRIFIEENYPGELSVMDSDHR